MPLASEAAGEKPDAVDGRGDGDHPGEPDPVADPARRRARPRCSRLRPRRGCTSRSTSGSSSPTVTYSTTNVRAPANVPSQAVFATRNVATSRFERSTFHECATYVRTPSNTRPWPPSSVTNRIGTRHATDTTPDGDEERRRAPEVEEVAAADQPAGDRDPAEDVLDALGAAEDALGQHVGVQAPVRRLVDVVREEQPEQHQRRRPEVRHERDQREREGHRAERDEHERPPAGRAACGTCRSTGRSRAGASARRTPRRRARGRRASSSPCTGRGSAAGTPRSSSAPRRARARPPRGRACRGARRRQATTDVRARPPWTTSTIVRSARATSSSPSGSLPITQPVRISSSPP